MTSHSCLFVLFFVYCCFAGEFPGDCQRYNPYNARLPSDVVSYHIDQDLSSGLNVSLDMFYPDTPGEYQVLLFLSGLNGDVPTIFYSDVLKGIAAHGLILFGVDLFPNNPTHYNMSASTFIETMNWLSENLNPLMNTLTNSTIVADMSKGFILSGHSSGNQGIVQTYYNAPELVTALVLLDPVDTSEHSVITKGTKIQNNIPVFVLASGLGDIPGVNNTNYPACCPRGWSSKHYYTAFQAPKWYINATLYGHADILNPLMAEAAKKSHFCAAHADGNLTKYYRQEVYGSVSAFVNLVLNNQCSCQDYLQSPEQMPTDVVVHYDLGTFTCSTQ